MEGQSPVTVRADAVPPSGHAKRSLTEREKPGKRKNGYGVTLCAGAIPAAFGRAVIEKRTLAQTRGPDSRGCTPVRSVSEVLAELSHDSSGAKRMSPEAVAHLS